MKDRIENLKREACKIAKELLESDEEYIDNMFDLWQIGEKLLGSVWHTEFHIFGLIASDTDHLPTKNVRQYCSNDMLRKSDAELAEIIQYYKNDVNKACNEILSKYQNI